MALNITQVYNDLLSKIGIETPANATALQQQDAVIAINQAMQMLATAGQDFLVRQKLTVVLTPGTSLYKLAQATQNILGPARLNDSVPLRALESRGELDQFDRIFLGAATYGAAAGTPIAYWIESLNSGTNSGDTQVSNLWLAPSPNAGGTVVLELANDAQPYAVADITAGTAILPVTHGYTESVFLPLARLYMCRSSEFSRPDLLTQIEEDAKIAMDTLGFKGGFPNAVQPAPKREVNG